MLCMTKVMACKFLLKMTHKTKIQCSYTRKSLLWQKAMSMIIITPE